MPIVIDRPGSGRRASTGVIEIGLLNLLSDTALKSCERQIAELVEVAAGSAHVRLRLFSLSGIARSKTTQKRIATHYFDLDALLGSRLDGLFVTGAEPSTERLSDEPFWSQLTEVIDWARSHTGSTMWSCLAAHAAVLHLDGIERRRLPEKCSGSFSIEPVSGRCILSGVGEARVYHSRWNDVSEPELIAAGFDILTRGKMGADIFLKDYGSRFVFLQGHPEYDAGALGREYRRDVVRYLSGARADYPAAPVDYFKEDTMHAIRRFEAEARRVPRPEMIDHLPIVDATVGPPSAHRTFAEALFRDWLQLMASAQADHAAA